MAAFDDAYIGNLEPIIAPPLQFNPSIISHSLPGNFVDINGETAQGIVAGTSWLNNPIVAKLQDIVLLIKRVVTFRPNNSVVSLTWSPVLEQQCIEFFSTDFPNSWSCTGRFGIPESPCDDTRQHAGQVCRAYP